MKNISRLLCAVTISAFVALTAGCASTATQESTGQIVDSSIITTNVKAALAGDDLGTLTSVEVETFKDIVQLSGFVNTEEEKTTAGTIAEAVDGVMKVENNLIVK
ncbi:BON domain-containing protein [Granulosicoccus antarcticus]|uniref:Osmotically-inducible protein Y n=1 Tax=Granulosicoccus antarcticus IMCC3135 TaxID=1192854 RepID=A0A2Z2P6D1_9GAMM|nr:BON domain-containing protein [Granulosicoccus antarcticus]ASJ76267.1 Osmotically-inducible protein Y [Granulosicoccus antarcticus IMCC3135]